MKYIITTALALTLAGGAALAQERHDDNRGGERGGAREEHRAPQGAPGGHVGGPPSGALRPGGPQGAMQGPGRPPGAMQGGRPQGTMQAGRPDFRPGPGGNERRDDNRGPGPRPGMGRGPEPGFRAGGFLRDRGWQGGHFRAPSYRYPSGWGYQRWAFGALLPSVFFAPDYLLGSYWTYGLPAPPPGYHWIRVGPDALLARYGDGYILDAAYGVFY